MTAPEELALANHYVSTYCMHGAHRSCRLQCKTCGEPCRCSCGHPEIDTPGPYAELLGWADDLVGHWLHDNPDAFGRPEFVRAAGDLAAALRSAIAEAQAMAAVARRYRDGWKATASNWFRANPGRHAEAESFTDAERAALDVMARLAATSEEPDE